MRFKINSYLENKSKGMKFNTTISKIIVTTKQALKDTEVTFSNELQPWQTKELGKKSLLKIAGVKGPIWFITLDSKIDETHQGALTPSPYAIARESIGAMVSQLKDANSKNIMIEFYGCSKETIRGAIVGLDLGLYRFTDDLKLGTIKFTSDSKKLGDKVISDALEVSKAINQARHLVNLPPNMLNPVSYANEIKKLFSNSKSMKVTIYDEKKLAKENCGLLLSVGNSSDSPPRIVKISYRQGGAKGKLSNLVGKGITFDSGGLDMKSAAGMRLMKKDMGGSACLVGFARWLENSKIKKNINIYLAIAENLISEKSSRPSDIYTARNGLKIEIHNTDAEGRLVLADAIDLAMDDKPAELIDVATLTGAGKIALGQDIGSLFSNDDKLADKLQAASGEMGDLMWRMPLYSPYMKGLNSDFADMTNAASGHGGAITAALFIEKFVGKTKWAHLDIFSWTSGAKPSLVQKGGSGQGVETLIGYFS